MPSDTVNELVGTLSELESRLKQFDAEARRLGELRGELKGTTAALQSSGKDLQSVTSALRDGAATMRELDMAATLKRLAEIEHALDARSKQLEATIDREIAELGESLKHQVSKQLDALPNQLGPTVASAFDKQFETTKRAIDSLVADAGTRHAELLASLRQGLEQHTTESKASAAAIGQAVTQLGAAARDASDRQMNALLRSLADADARSSAQAKSTEAIVQAGTQRAARLALVAALLAAAALAAAVVGIFI
jgi:hypothetical protein